MKKNKTLTKLFGLIVIVGLLVAVLPVGQVQAATITVCTSGCDQTSIQAAIDVASDGDTIEVGPGTYVEGASGDAKALDITVPNLTIKSTGGRDATTLDAGGATTAVWVNANLGGVTFEGFTVVNFKDNGIVQSRTQRLGTTFHILNNKVFSSNGYLRNGLQISGDGSSVKGNIVYGSPLTDEWDSTGIGVVDATNAVVSGNTIEANDGEGNFPDIGINVMSYDIETTSILVENNTVSNAGDGIRVSAVDRVSPEPPDVKDVTITGNTISECDISFNVSKANVVGLIIENNNIDKVVEIEGEPDIYSTIQGAIDAASDGDTILVGPGTYEENIFIDKPLTLLGPNHEIAGDSDTRVDEAIIMNSVELGTNIKIESPDVTVKGFFLEGNEKARNGIWFEDQFAENTDLNITIQNNKIIKIGNDGTVKEERGRGIYFTNPVESSNTNLRGQPYVFGIDISYNYVQYAEGGIILRDNVYANIGYNKVENANEGILVEWVATPIDPLLLDEHTVHHNTVIIHDEYGWNENTGFAEYHPDIKDTLGCSGIRLNVIGGGAKVIARENNVSASTASNPHSGFNVASLNSGKVLLYDNVITDVRDGIRLWGTQESGGEDANLNPLISQNFQVFGGTITGGTYGIHITDWYYKTGYDENVRGTVGLQNRVYLDGNLQISGQSGHKIRIFNDNVDYRDVTVKLGMNLATNVDFDNPDDVEKVNEFVDLNGEDPNTLNTHTAEIFIIKLVARIGDNHYPSIQEAIDAAVDGDTILVGPGTYAEALVLDVPNLTVKSVEGAETTIIDVPVGELIGVNVLKNMGEVKFDGFSVKYNQTGINQGMGASEGTAFHVLNNIVVPKGTELRNGIQVSGNDSIVKGNFVSTAYYQPGKWASTAIGVVNAQDVLVENNVVSGIPNGGDTGISIYAWGEGKEVESVDVTGNTISDIDYPFNITSYVHGTVDGVTLFHNQATNYLGGLVVTPYPEFESGGTTYAAGGPVTDVVATENWWGSEAGPLAVEFSENFDATLYTPWCADDTCATFLPDENNEIELPDGASTEEVNAAINNAPAGSTVIIPAGTYNNTGGFVLDKPGVTIILKEGVVIQNNSPCFEVFADNTTITSLGGAVCKPTHGDFGIVVQDGVTGLLIENFEIDGTDTGGTAADGIFFAGAVDTVTIRDMYIHNLPVNGIKFMQQPTGNVVIQGNLFKDNGDMGVRAPASLDVRYNAWGSYAGPFGVGGDGLPVEFDNFTPWTHVDLYLESDGTPNPDQVVWGETITYKVMGNVQQLMGAEVTLDYPDGLEFVADSETCVFDVCTVTNTAGVLNFLGFNYTDVSGTEDPSEPVSGENVELFSVQFTGETEGLAQPLTFDSTTDNFSMHPGYGPSSTILADELVNGTVDVIDLPTLNSDDLDGPYYQGFSQEFTITVTNPTTGVTFEDSLLTLSGFVDATLEYFDGTAWVSVPLTDGVGSITTDLIANGLGNDYLFRVIFNSPGSRNLDVELFDTEPNPDWSLASFTASDVTVHGSFAVTGFVSMQGRSYTGNVPVTLTMAEALYGPFTENSLNYLVDNVMFTGVPMGTYTFTTNQPRYLNVHAGLGKTFPVNSAFDFGSLELKGGNAQWTDNVINLADAALVAGAYGSTDDSDANVNFDGKVNIQDLALVGGNYNLTSEVAYADFNPEPSPVLEGVSPATGELLLTEDDSFVLIVDAADSNLYELEIDHSMQGTLDEFSVYANASDPYGGDGALFATAGVTVVYDEAEQKWTIDFGTNVSNLIRTNGGITFYLVLVDDAGNKWGSMYETTAENTFAYTVVALDAANPFGFYNDQNELESYPTLQGAITAASDGDTIYMAAGTHQISNVITWNKDLTLVGAQGSGTTIDTGSMSTHVFNLTNNSDITLKNIHFVGNENNSQLSVIRAGSTVLLDKIEVDGCTFENYRYNIYLNERTTDPVLEEHNKIGILIVRNNTFINVPNTGYSTYFGRGIVDYALIENNISFGGIRGFQFFDPSPDFGFEKSTGDISISNNIFHEVTQPIVVWGGGETTITGNEIFFSGSSGTKVEIARLYDYEIDKDNYHFSNTKVSGSLVSLDHETIYPWAHIPEYATYPLERFYYQLP